VARRFAAEHLDRWGLGDLAETATLLVSELVTNAVLHGDGDRRLDVEATGDAVRFAVHDGGAGRPERRQARPGELSGRGLALVEALAPRWGVEPRPDSGKIVWFELDTEPDSVPR
jgi:anti-sigma regulatory factor (Ser/Thr protein kinase)